MRRLCRWYFFCLCTRKRPWINFSSCDIAVFPLLLHKPNRLGLMTVDNREAKKKRSHSLHTFWSFDFSRIYALVAGAARFFFDLKQNPFEISHFFLRQSNVTPLIYFMGIVYVQHSAHCTNVQCSSVRRLADNNFRDALRCNMLRQFVLHSDFSRNAIKHLFGLMLQVVAHEL